MSAAEIKVVEPGEAGFCRTDSDCQSVVAILVSGGQVFGYVYSAHGRLYTESGGAGRKKLISLPPPKTYRPYRRGEVKCGDVFRSKSGAADQLLTRVGSDYVSLSGSVYSYRELLDEFTHLDGTPAGVVE